MASTDLQLQRCGTLPKPGLVGRMVRLVFGVLCLYYVYSLWGARFNLLSSTGGIHLLLWNGIIPGLFLVSYVINIGFSRAWKKWPAIISAIILLITAGVGYTQSGQVDTMALARALWIWELYVFSHLGLSFIVAAILATPGCEMRAFFHLFSVVTGKPTKEHICPIGPLSAIDKWENNRVQ